MVNKREMKQRIYSALGQLIEPGDGGPHLDDARTYALLRGSLFDEPTPAGEERWRRAVHEVAMTLFKLSGLDLDDD